MYRYGLPVDPLTVLDLSAVTDRENVIPDEYRLKYLNDHILRPINVIDLKFAEGRTVNERSQNFLSAYAQ